MSVEKTERKKEMIELKEQGYTYEAIANKYGISKQRVGQILHQNHNGRENDGRKRWILNENSAYPNLSKWIIENDITAGELAERIGITYVTLSAYLNGKRDMKLKTAKKICDVTGKTMQELFMDE